MSDYFVPVFFHEQDVDISAGVDAPFGHAGWIQIKSDGSYAYYEYGRYNGTSGALRNPLSGGQNSVSFNPDGSPNIEGILSNLHSSSGHSGKGDISASVFEVANGSFDTLQGIYSSQVNQQNFTLGPWTPWNSCYGVMMDAASTVGVSLDFIDGALGFTPAGVSAHILNTNGGILYDVDEDEFHTYAASPLNAALTFLDEYGNPVTLLMKALSPWAESVATIYASAGTQISPLVLDLDDSGTIELTSLANSTTYWDIDVDGFAEHSGWVTGGDGLLAIDLNEDGIINDNTELFGNSTGYANGFAALA